MVAFDKYLEREQVPEWISEYCNYSRLEDDLNAIIAGSKPLTHETAHTPKQVPIRESIDGLLRRRSSISSNEFIKLHHVQLSETDDLYRTELLDPIDKDVKERIFFSRLDGQLNKVTRFYRMKEAEYIEQAAALERQMNMLIKAQKLLMLLKARTSRVDESSVRAVIPNNPDISSLGFKDQEEIVEDANEEADIENMPGAVDAESDRVGSDHFIIKPIVATPYSTIHGIYQMLLKLITGRAPTGHVDVRLLQDKVRCAKQMLRAAFIEFYHGLRLLKGYSSLNLVTFSKILRKYDIAMGREVSGIYMDMIRKSYFNTSNHVINLIRTVETLFTEHFANHNRINAIKCLRSGHYEDSHTVSFFTGLFTACSVALALAYGLVIHFTGSYNDPTSDATKIYMATVYPIHSALALIIIHIFTYGCDVWAWRQARVNSAFIFGAQHGTDIKHGQVFLLASMLSTLLLAGMVAHLVAHVRDKSSNIDYIPLALSVIFPVLLFLPLNILYRSTRYFFIRIFFRVILAPLFSVILPDFFMADQLCSQVPMFRHGLFLCCYYFGGHYRRHKNADVCHKDELLKEVIQTVGLLPYWWRFAQCIRRWYDEEHQKRHLVNAGKYFSAMIGTGAKIQYNKTKTKGCLIFVIITSAWATGYQFLWDSMIDWGLLQPDSLNPWLRNKLMLKRKWIYYVSLVLNLLLRLAWLQSVTGIFDNSNVDRRFIDFALAALEVCRRGHWNFYRLENEHLNNVGNFRAVRVVPTPFKDPDDPS